MVLYQTWKLSMKRDFDKIAKLEILNCKRSSQLDTSPLQIPHSSKVADPPHSPAQSISELLPLQTPHSSSTQSENVQAKKSCD